MPYDNQYLGGAILLIQQKYNVFSGKLQFLHY